jgi:hypothetical protein
MIIDCDRCEMRDVACDDCVVSALLMPTAGRSGDPIAGDTATALQALGDAGLTRPLRLRLPPAASG